MRTTAISVIYGVQELSVSDWSRLRCFWSRIQKLLASPEDTGGCPITREARHITFVIRRIPLQRGSSSLLACAPESRIHFAFRSIHTGECASPRIFGDSLRRFRRNALRRDFRGCVNTIGSSVRPSGA